MELSKLSDKHAGEARPQPDALIRHGDQAALEELVLAKVRQAAADDSLLKCPKLPEILSLWQDLAGNAEPITWVQQVVGDDRHLANLLEKFMEKDFSHSMMQVHANSRYRLNQKTLAPFLDPGSILDRARALTESEWLGQPQKDALRQFIKHHELTGH
jgi:predicted KAP-like P-loop ATPase